mmetsp:Transcript_31446/g.91934  ORF Transcript_31446/g.91934 Transcript_31446/m.91934 type:complete len:728 (-) Transcript_31446:89-2272(-)
MAPRPLRHPAPALMSALLRALLPAAAVGVSLRAPKHQAVPNASSADAVAASGAPATAAAAPAAMPVVQSPEAEKVEHLLQDVDESVRKAGSDAEFVYATLYSYDQQLHTNLEQEIARVEKEVGKLKAMKMSYNTTVDEALKALGEDKEDAPVPATPGPRALSPKELEDQKEAMKTVECFIREGNAKACLPPSHSSEGASRMKLAEAVRSAQGLLKNYQKELSAQFGDVYAALLPGKHSGKALKVHLTRKLRARTLQALAVISQRLEKQTAEVLLQESARERRRSSAAAAAEARARAREGLEAEVQQNVEEVAFSVTFAEAVLRIDKEFLVQVQESMHRKADLIAAIRDCRNTQHETLSSVVDLLKGEFSVSTASTAAPASKATAGSEEDGVEEVEVVDTPDAAPSFLQAGAATKSGARRKNAHETGEKATAGLQAEVEDALRKKADTHNILLRVKAMLDHSAPVDADGVRSVVGGLRGVLSELEGEKTRAAQVASLCDAQMSSAAVEEKALRANLVLMNAARNRTLAAVAAAKSNLVGIVRKSQTLEQSAKEFAAMVNKASSTLEDEANDRRTMMAAIDKARGVVAQHTSGGAAADGLLVKMMQELRRQDEMELAYRVAEMNFRKTFVAYAGNYIQLLHERHGHYMSSLSALELYANEVEADLATQTDALSTRTELRQQNHELCAGLASYYDKHRAHASELASTLKKVIPEVPSVLSDSDSAAAVAR